MQQVGGIVVYVGLRFVVLNFFSLNYIQPLSWTFNYFPRILPG